MIWLLTILIFGIMIMSIFEFVCGDVKRNNRRHILKDSRFSHELFYTLFMIYIIVLLGFGCIYFLLSLEYVVLLEHNEIHDGSFVQTLLRSIYFSGVTLLTIGYGDISPVGIGRVIAIFQALISYILPTAFVLRIVQGNRSVQKQY